MVRLRKTVESKCTDLVDDGCLRFGSDAISSLACTQLAFEVLHALLGSAAFQQRGAIHRLRRAEVGDDGTREQTV
jgi:hypothetical protein